MNKDRPIDFGDLRINCPPPPKPQPEFYLNRI